MTNKGFKLFFIRRWKVRKFFFVVISLFVLAPILNVEEEYDFRNTKWGMSPEEVHKLDIIDYKMTGVSSESFFYLRNIDSIDNKKCMVAYYFIENILIAGAYSFSQKYYDKNEYINDYINLKENLKKKYGEPIKDDVIWFNDSYKDDPRHYGLAVSEGDLKYQSIWEIDGTEIILFLIGDNLKCNLILRYKSKKYEYLSEKLKEKILSENSNKRK